MLIKGVSNAIEDFESFGLNLGAIVVRTTLSVISGHHCVKMTCLDV